jgi:hypothetical protein
MGQVFLAGEKAQERPALLRDMIANRATQHWVTGLECVEDRAQSHLALDFDFYVAVNVGQRSQVGWKSESNHSSVIMRA